MLEFKNKFSLASLSQMYPSEYGFDNEMRARVLQNIQYWNFYEGYHWQDIPEDGERPQITKNYCRKIIDKFVSYEFGGGVEIQCEKEGQDEFSGQPIITDYLNSVWNKPKSKAMLMLQIGQIKGITGDSWVQILYESPEDLAKNDPYGDTVEAYPKGRIRLYVLPPNVVFPVYDDLDKDKLKSLMIGIPVKGTNVSTKYQVHKETWTADKIIIQEPGKDEVVTNNAYGIIPFERVGNCVIAGDSIGVSDLADAVPLNTEINGKTSDVSEILDYYASPITVISGAKISSLEKGPNKLWGLPSGASAKNLEIQGDLGASINYIRDLKETMFELACMPPEQFGGVSNTSGVALNTLASPTIEKTRVKRIATEDAFKNINRKILKMATFHKLFEKPEGYSLKDVYTTTITFKDITPKDTLQEIQTIKEEIDLRLESRSGAMKRLGRTDISEKIKEIDAEVEKKEDLIMEKQLKLTEEQQKIAVKNQNVINKPLT